MAAYTYTHVSTTSKVITSFFATALDVDENVSLILPLALALVQTCMGVDIDTAWSKLQTQDSRLVLCPVILSF
eukprot:scaffold4557_cov74-Cyclotella_meneghiniana.AAC.4